MLGIAVLDKDGNFLEDINIMRYKDVDSIANQLAVIADNNNTTVQDLLFEGTNYRIPDIIASSGIIGVWIEWRDAYLDIELNINKEYKDLEAAKAFAMWFIKRNFRADEIATAKVNFMDKYLTTCEDEFDAGACMIEDKLGHKIPVWLDCYILHSEFCRCENFYETVHNYHSGRIHILKKGRWI